MPSCAWREPQASHRPPHSSELLLTELLCSRPPQEENVIEILKTKPADRGHHVGGMQACLKPVRARPSSNPARTP